MTRWKQEDEMYQSLKGLLDTFYTGRNTLPERLTLAHMHPGLMRLEPCFHRYMKDIPAHLKPAYLLRGRHETEQFTLFLKQVYLGQVSPIQG